MRPNFLVAAFAAVSVVLVTAGIVYGEVEGIIFGIAAAALGIFVATR